MALVETTLSSACAINDKTLALASGTSIAAGRLLRIDSELMVCVKGTTAATTTPEVLRGQYGTAQEAHPVSARVVHGDAGDFASNAIGQAAPYPMFGRTQRHVSISATGSLTLPQVGEDLFVVLNGTSVIALTVPVPTKDLDGARLTIVANGAAAHTITFTGGLSGASTSYDVVTMNGTGPIALEVVACNEVWISPVQVPMAGTVTNITGTVA